MHDPKGTAGRDPISSARHWLQAAETPRMMVPEAVLDIETAPARQVYLALSKRATYSTGIVSATYEQIASDAHMPRSSVASAVKKLVEQGWLEQISKGKHHTASRYQLRAESAAARAERAAELHELVSSPDSRTAEAEPVDNSVSSPNIRTHETLQQSEYPDAGVRIFGPSSESFQSTTSNQPAPAADPGARQGWMDGSAAEDENTPGSDLLQALSVKLGLPVGGAVIRDLAPAVGARLRFGWKADDLLAALGEGLMKAANPIGALRARVCTGEIVPMKPASAISKPVSSVPPVCGSCEGRNGEPIGTRLLADGSKCPRCHPYAHRAAQVIELDSARRERVEGPFDQVLARLTSAKAIPS